MSSTNIEDKSVTQEEFKQAIEDYKKNVVDVLNMDLLYVVKLSLEEQCNYADNITKKYCTDPRFLKEIISNFKGVSDKTSACVIGNLAYIAKENNNEHLLTLLENLRK